MQRCYGGEGGGCAEIVRYQIDQHAKTYDLFQVPEPWVGQIDVARILFVSSNPSIGKEDHAQGASPDVDIWESHHFAFGGGGHRAYITDGAYITDREGRRIKAVRYWSWARRRAMELIPMAVPGTDYALTEVVHCKSTKEIGVAAAAVPCIARHFDKVTALAAARVVVAVGAFANRQIFAGITPDRPVKMNLGGRPRLVVGLAHPSGFSSGKTLAGRYSAEDLKLLSDAANS